jgi:hypothetical protein
VGLITRSVYSNRGSSHFPLSSTVEDEIPPPTSDAASKTFLNVFAFSKFFTPQVVCQTSTSSSTSTSTSTSSGPSLSSPQPIRYYQPGDLLTGRSTYFNHFEFHLSLCQFTCFTPSTTRERYEMNSGFWILYRF